MSDSQFFRKSNTVVKERRDFVVVERKNERHVVTFGQAGLPGRSAYQIAVDTGFVGDEAAWLESLQGQDGVSGNASHVHEQIIPSDVWVINHPLDKYPSVTCMDSAGDEIDGLLSYASRDQLTMTFAAATGGKAYLN